jgi:hypothetical protein
MRPRAHLQTRPEGRTTARRPPGVIVIALLFILLSACGDDGDAASTLPPTRPGGIPVPLELDSHFTDGSEGWAADISDFTEATRPDDFVAETGVAPSGFDPSSGYFHLAAGNRSDDLFMFLRRSLGVEEGLVGSTPYRISFTVEFASDAPTGCAGIGGAPGEAVYLKVGASDTEPAPVGTDDGVRLSVDKGNQSGSGADVEVAGDIANGLPCDEALDQDPVPYIDVTRQHDLGEPVTTAPDGTLWLLVGTDSGFEGRTSLYYDRIVVTLTPVE